MLDKWMNAYKDWANFILRSFVGFIFLAHGAQKLFGVFGGPGLEGAGKMSEQFGFVPGEKWALAVGIVELVGRPGSPADSNTRPMFASVCCGLKPPIALKRSWPKSRERWRNFPSRTMPVVL